MYIKINQNITPDQLVAIAKILDTDGLECINNIHYELCEYEIECVIDNAMDQESAERFKSENKDTIEKWANFLYDNSNYQWCCLYEKAEEIVDLELDDFEL